jgi:hypothetical protein
MLITTRGGILVNTRYVAYVALKKYTEERPAQTPAEPHHKVLLFLAGGDVVVAADRLTRGTAEFLRKEIAHHWSQGCALLDVKTSLTAHQNGGYYAEETADVSSEGGS